MGSLKQLPHCRKCWSCICSLFYFSDITPSLLMSMNRRISEARHLAFVQNPSRDDLPLCHKLSRNLLSLFFCTVSFDIQELLQELFGNHWHRFTNQYLSTHHGSYIGYAPKFSGYNRKLVVWRSLYWKSSQLFSPSQTPVWPLPTPPPTRGEDSQCSSANEQSDSFTVPVQQITRLKREHKEADACHKALGASRTHRVRQD